MEEKISKFMLTFSKFEYFIVNFDPALAQIYETKPGIQKVTGVDWNKMAGMIEDKYPFYSFNFLTSGFQMLKETPPQFITRDQDGKLKWDCDDTPIENWESFLTRGLAQLRNNIAHGNKAHMTAPFTHGRTEEFLVSAYGFIDFLAVNIFGDKYWETPIIFKN